MKYLGCSKTNIHESVKFGKNVKIISDDITIGEGTEIGDNTTIIAYEKLVIGKFCKIRPNAQFKARSIEIGDYFYSDDNPRPLIIGGGGAEGPTARIRIGKRCVMHDSFINVFMPVEIGDDVGMSPSSDIQNI
jgi:acetyltransferase-like isoleucine patch superfamily enzyme